MGKKEVDSGFEEVFERAPDLRAALAQIDRQFGDGTIMPMAGESQLKIEGIPTGSLALDMALGGKGVPRGRIVELFGPESCLDGDTHIHFSVWTPDGRRQNHKGGTIRRLYERFHGIDTKRPGPPESVGARFMVPSINQDDCVFSNEVADVVHTGQKECFTVTTEDGNSITATADHKFYVGNGQYEKLISLSVGDCLYTHNKTPNKQKHKRFRYMEVCVKYHPSQRWKSVGGYKYCRVRKSRLLVEADMNGMSYEEYVSTLNSDGAESIDANIKTLPSNLHVHHINEQHRDDRLENLAVIEGPEHNRHHATVNHNNLRFIVTPTRIVSIVPAGMRDTYDIKCYYPHNNYIANKFAVHNCGKTTIALHICAQAQAAGGVAALIDAEHAFDPGWAKKIGVQLEALLVSQPSTGEEALQLVEQLVKTNSLDVIIVDSVAALVPKQELDGDMGQSHVGLQARLMSQAMRKLVSVIANSKTVVIFINQIREKVGVMFGSPETTPGGRALKFAASCRIDVRRAGHLKEGEAVIGQRVRCKVVKNKVAPPFREAEFDMMHSHGISYEGDLLDVGVARKVVDRAGAWLKFGDVQLGNGKEKARQFLLENREIAAAIRAKVIGAA